MLGRRGARQARGGGPGGERRGSQCPVLGRRGARHMLRLLLLALQPVSMPRAGATGCAPARSVDKAKARGRLNAPCWGDGVRAKENEPNSRRGIRLNAPCWGDGVRAVAIARPNRGELTSQCPVLGRRGARPLSPKNSGFRLHSSGSATDLPAPLEKRSPLPFCEKKPPSPHVANHETPTLYGSCLKVDRFLRKNALN